MIRYPETRALSIQCCLLAELNASAVLRLQAYSPCTAYLSPAGQPYTLLRTTDNRFPPSCKFALQGTKVTLQCCLTGTVHCLPGGWHHPRHGPHNHNMAPLLPPWCLLLPRGVTAGFMLGFGMLLRGLTGLLQVGSGLGI